MNKNLLKTSDMSQQLFQKTLKNIADELVDHELFMIHDDDMTPEEKYEAFFQEYSTVMSEIEERLNDQQDLSDEDDDEVRGAVFAARSNVEELLVPKHAIHSLGEIRAAVMGKKSPKKTAKKKKTFPRKKTPSVKKEKKTPSLKKKQTQSPKKTKTKKKTVSKKNRRKSTSRKPPRALYSLSVDGTTWGISKSCRAILRRSKRSNNFYYVSTKRTTVPDDVLVAHDECYQR
jgi:hypothetical protein